MDPDPTLNFK